VAITLTEYHVLASYLDDTTTAAEPWLVEPPEGAKIVAVHLEAKNVDVQQRTFPTHGRFSLLYWGENAQRHYGNLTIQMPLYDNNCPYDPYPGVSCHGWIAYLVPKAADPHEMIVVLDLYHPTCT